MAIDTTRPRLFVPAPTPAPLPYGLLSVADERTPTDPHAQLGVQFEPLHGLTGGIATINADGTQSGSLSAEDFTVEDTALGLPYNGTFPTVYTNPFLIFAGVTAKPIGHTVEELQDRATAKLAMGAQYWIEQGLWVGSSGGHHLAASTTTTLGGGSPVTVQQGIGLLEEWIGNQLGAQGVIHASRKCGPALWNEVRATGNKLMTAVAGTPVALGTGYRNTAPGDAAANTNVGWLYATGPVVVHRSDVQLREVPSGQKTTLNQNITTVYATEIVSVGFAPGTSQVAAAVPVSL